MNSIISKKTQLLKELKEKLVKCNSINDLTIIKNTFINNNITPLYAQLKKVSKEEKHDFGAAINIFKNEALELFNSFIEQIELKEDDSKHEPKFDLNINSANYSKGSLTAITIMTKEILDFFSKLDFQIVNGSEITSVKYNFDFLNVPLDHPGRQTSESFYFNPTTMLRGHCTASTAEQLVKQHKQEKIKVLTYGNVYRNDDDDATHSHQFTQVDLVWVEEGLSVANLKWLLSSMLKYLYGDKVKIRYRLSFFPFTEPSIEADIACPYCGGKGCPVCKKTGWIEVLGSGMLAPNVMAAAGVNVKSGIAFGIGIERLVMIKYGIKDIRDVYTNDFRFLNQFKQENK